MASTTSAECPHCGRWLKRNELELNGKMVFAGFEPCQCEGARRERARLLAEEERKRREEEEAARQRAYARAGLKPRFLLPLPDELAPMADRIVAALKEGRAEGRGAYLCGTVGTGKTHIATEVGRRMVDARWGVLMTSSDEIITKAADTWGGPGTEESVFARLSRCDLLIIDELGKEQGRDWSISRLFRVVNDRYENMRPVVVTTQYPRKRDLIARLARSGEEETAVAIVSRLTQICVSVPTGGEDRRIRHGER